MTRKQVERAAAALRAAVDAEMASWRALNDQIKWSIHDKVQAHLDLLRRHGPRSQAPLDVRLVLRTMQQHGAKTPAYWQQFDMMTDGQQKAEIEAALQRLGVL